MLPLIIGGLIAALIRRNQYGQAIQIPQFRGGGVDQNAVAAPQPIIPLAMREEEIYIGASPPGPGQPVGLGSIPELSGLTEFEQVMGLPDPDAVSAVQINPSMNNIAYGPIRG